MVFDMIVNIDSRMREAVLRKMMKHHFIGGKHTDIRNIPKGFPKHFYKEILKVLDDIMKEGYIIKKPTQYGFHVSLNPRMMDEIKKEIGLVD